MIVARAGYDPGVTIKIEVLNRRTATKCHREFRIVQIPDRDNVSEESEFPISYTQNKPVVHHLDGPQG